MNENTNNEVKEIVEEQAPVAVEAVEEVVKKHSWGKAGLACTITLLIAGGVATGLHYYKKLKGGKKDNGKVPVDNMSVVKNDFEDVEDEAVEEDK